jgi:hypothetical protein
MSRPVIAAFAMPDRGHFQRSRPLVADLVGRGARVVFTHPAFAADVMGAGAAFVDLFEGREVDQPGLAVRCQELDLAVAPPTARQLESAIERVTSRRPLMAEALANAGLWEREVVAGRPAVLDRILALA